MWKPVWEMARKDLYLLRKKLLGLLISAGLIIGIIVTVNGIGGEIGFLPAIFFLVFVLTYSFTNQTCYYEDKNNSLAFIRALPVSTEQIVAGRFLALLTVTGGALLIGCLVLLVFRLATPSAVNWLKITVYGLFAGLICLCFNGFVVFVYYRWGYTKIMYIYAIAFITIFVGGMTAGILFPGLPAVITGTPFLPILAFTLPVVMAVLFFLWYASVKAVKELDLA